MLTIRSGSRNATVVWIGGVILWETWPDENIVFTHIYRKTDACLRLHVMHHVIADLRHYLSHAFVVHCHFSPWLFVVIHVCIISHCTCSQICFFGYLACFVRIFLSKCTCIHLPVPDKSSLKIILWLRRVLQRTQTNISF